MPIQSVVSDPSTLTLKVVGVFPVPVARLWKAWTRAELIEQFWGPPEWPATFTQHEVRPGGVSLYHMTGPDGTRMHGRWDVVEVEAEKALVVQDVFCDAEGKPNHAMPSCSMRLTFETTATGSQFQCTTHFPDLESMEKQLAMGMLEGMKAALAQMDDVLAELAQRPAVSDMEQLDGHRVRVTRHIRGSVEQVWAAHHDAALMRRWMLGPDGWTMPVCEPATEVGQSYRYEWTNGEESFGFTGELLESEAPNRSLTTELMIGMPGPGTTNELVLQRRPGGQTRLVLTITYPSAELRDLVLGTGMLDGMEASYARLEGQLGAVSR